MQKDAPGPADSRATPAGGPGRVQEDRTPPHSGLAAPRHPARAAALVVQAGELAVDLPDVAERLPVAPAADPGRHALDARPGGGVELRRPRQALGVEDRSPSRVVAREHELAPMVLDRIALPLLPQPAVVRDPRGDVALGVVDPGLELRIA